MQGRHHEPRPLLAGVLELKRGHQAWRGAGGGVRWEEENDRVAHILIVEDDQAVAEVVHDQLVMAGHSVAVARDGATALRLLETRPADLVILDWKLPGLDGLEVCRRIRARSMTPILMLTVRAEEVDRVLGLEVGADDYLTKPFSMRELLARTRALLRRVALMSQQTPGGGEQTSASAVLVVGDLRIDVAGRAVSLSGTPLELTPKEFDLLHLLARHPGRVYSRAYLLQHIWGLAYVGMDRTVDSHVVHLRKKLGPFGERVVAVWGVGYKLRTD
jgi:DNA-binding response OmpR family regulator